MGFGPSLVIRGAVLGSILVSVFGVLITAGISFPAPVRAEALPAQAAAPPPRPNLRMRRQPLSQASERGMLSEQPISPAISSSGVIG